MHNSTQISIILTLLVFAAIWILLNYIFYRIRRDDDAGLISRGELKAASKLKKAKKAVVASYMYTGWILRAISTDNSDKEKYHRTAELSSSSGAHIRIDIALINRLFRTDRWIYIKDVEITPSGTVILYGLTLKGKTLMLYYLVRYNSLIKSLMKYI